MPTVGPTDNSAAMPATPQPLRRRWKRWAVIAIPLLAGLAWLALVEPPEIEGSRDVRLGQTKAEVSAIVYKWIDSRYQIAAPVVVRDGIETQSSSTEGYLLDSRQKPFRFLASTIRHWTGWRISFGLRSPSDFDAWPVHIRFDANGRVDRIKRGSEIVAAPASPMK
jgi:hypothetical protein